MEKKIPASISCVFLGFVTEEHERRWMPRLQRRRDGQWNALRGPFLAGLVNGHCP
jgi:hypothetical protein